MVGRTDDSRCSGSGRRVLHGAPSVRRIRESLVKADKVRELDRGRAWIDPLMKAYGFSWHPGWAGRSSGGHSASGAYRRGNRSLELHFRHALGLVTYRLGDLVLSHDEYMREVAERGCSRYPGFSDDPQDGFRHLAHDLEHFAADFLSGNGRRFRTIAAAAARRRALPGLRRLPK